MRGRPVARRRASAQKTELLLDEPRDIDEGLRSDQRRQQAQQRHLVERINKFASWRGSGRSLKCSRKTTVSLIAPDSAAAFAILSFRSNDPEVTSGFSTSPCHAARFDIPPD